MARTLAGQTWTRLERLRRQRRAQNAATAVLVLLGPALAALTYAAMGPFGPSTASTALRLVFLADLIYLILLTALVGARMARMIAARRSADAGSRLHMRLVGVFAGIALIPTVLVALFAGLMVNIGLENWFSSQVRSVVATSESAATAYQEEHRRDLTADARALAALLDEAGRDNPLIDDGALRILLTQGQARIQRGLREAYVIDAAGTIRARGERSYLFWYERPADALIAQAAAGDAPVLIEDWQNDEFRALLRLPQLPGRYLYVTRDVDGTLWGLLDQSRATSGAYQQLEKSRSKVLFEFSLVYLGFALLLVAAAIWMGLWFAERLSRPIGRLAAASERVGAGDLDVQVPEPDTGDEIQTLGRSFNRMTRQLKAQRSELEGSYRAADDQRRLFDSVLSSVTAGVIGLDAAAEIDFLNRSATRLVGIQPGDIDRPLADVVPEFLPLFDRLTASVADSVQDEIRLTRDSRMESLLVRIALRRDAAGAVEGYVIAFDDVTELVSAQRMAAWGDVARRVAHEIKNPLTPIQLSAERIRRKFARFAPTDEDREALAQYTDVIVRQTGDLRRIVDEFSRFARMPEPDRKEIDIAKLLRDAVVIQQDAVAGLTTDIPGQPVIVDCDAGMMGQVFTNLLKNAAEAVRDRPAGDWTPAVWVTMEARPDAVTIRIADNGVGLPQDRSRLFEPYVTLKPGGTGLGLPIVKKIVEEHGGSLALTDAPAGPDGHRGALAEIRLPRERQPVRLAARKQKSEEATGT